MMTLITMIHAIPLFGFILLYIQKPNSQSEAAAFLKFNGFCPFQLGVPELMCDSHIWPPSLGCYWHLFPEVKNRQKSAWRRWVSLKPRRMDSCTRAMIHSTPGLPCFPAVTSSWSQRCHKRKDLK